MFVTDIKYATLKGIIVQKTSGCIVLILYSSFNWKVLLSGINVFIIDDEFDTWVLTREANIIPMDFPSHSREIINLQNRCIIFYE